MTPRSFEEHRVDMSAAVPDGPKAALPANVFATSRIRAATER